MIRLIVSVMSAIVIIIADPAHAQSRFPAPLPSDRPALESGSPFAPVNDAALSMPASALGERYLVQLRSEPADACHKGVAALRDEAERRGRRVKAASDRRAPRAEACQVIGSFREA